MNKAEEIKTIKINSEYKFKEKGSVFLSKSFSISCEENINEILTAIRKEFYDATHHCYAYKINSPVSTANVKYSDDGEPSGTAGIRILNAIDHFDVTGCLVVVTRYFGGTKLGVGPLGKAYYNSAFNVLELSGILVKKPFRQVTINGDFPHLNLVHRIIARYDAKLTDTSYSDSITFTCLADANVSENMKSELIEASQNQLSVEINNTIIYL